MKRLVAGSRSTVATISARNASPIEADLPARRIGLTDEFGRHVGMVEPLADAMHDCRLERVVMQDVLVDEGGEFWLAARDVLGFAADARPDRIDLIEGRAGRV